MLFLIPLNPLQIKWLKHQIKIIKKNSVDYFICVNVNPHNHLLPYFVQLYKAMH